MTKYVIFWTRFSTFNYFVYICLQIDVFYFLWFIHFHKLKSFQKSNNKKIKLKLWKEERKKYRQNTTCHYTRRWCCRNHISKWSHIYFFTYIVLNIIITSLYFYVILSKIIWFFFWHWKQTSYPSLIWQIWKWYHYI